MTVTKFRIRRSWERLPGRFAGIFSGTASARRESHGVQGTLTLALMATLLVGAPPSAFCQGDAPPNTVLEGGVTVHAEPDLLGVWNVDLKKLHRHPRIVILDVQNNSFAGTYSGRLGTFPLRGSYDAATGNVLLSVDFSGSPLTRIGRLRKKSLVAEFQGRMESGMLRGVASMPDVTQRTVAWEAKKAQ